ncbi:MAG: NADH-quinone oxidoreductase subunit NuoE [Oscillospiraceae bacterium]|jgi:NADH-quinone oxidoreductase subunit E|nr:NADH-quinone oxidoreductase subunit NuoE [Oscillospiraceae bacterium]
MSTSPDSQVRTDFSALDPVFTEFSGVQGGLITILQKAQDVYGWLSRETLEHIASRTGVKPAKVYGVATFYAQFRLKPVGRYLIMLCKGTACHVNGSNAIEDAVTRALGIRDGETSADGMFTLNDVACLGCCSLAPVMMVRGSAGEETFGGLTPDRVQVILKEIAARDITEVPA